MLKTSGCSQNAHRFRLARLQAELSNRRCSEQGLLARIVPLLGVVFQSFIVSVKCRPGSAQFHAESQIASQISLAGIDRLTSLSRLPTRCQSCAWARVNMNLSLTLILLLAFCPVIVVYDSDCHPSPYPASARTLAFASSLAFHLMNSIISGWSSSITIILAARRVVPPDLIAPAMVSKTFRNDINPLDDPPPASRSPLARSELKFVPVPEPRLKSLASIVSRSMIPFSESPMGLMKQACSCG